MMTIARSYLRNLQRVEKYTRIEPKEVIDSKFPIAKKEKEYSFNIPNSKVREGFKENIVFVELKNCLIWESEFVNKSQLFVQTRYQFDSAQGQMSFYVLYKKLQDRQDFTEYAYLLFNPEDSNLYYQVLLPQSEIEVLIITAQVCDFFEPLEYKVDYQRDIFLGTTCIYNLNIRQGRKGHIHFFA
jgi:hypothetical protein